MFGSNRKQSNMNAGCYLSHYARPVYFTECTRYESRLTTQHVGEQNPRASVTQSIADVFDKLHMVLQPFAQSMLFKITIA